MPTDEISRLSALSAELRTGKKLTYAEHPAGKFQNEELASDIETVAKTLTELLAENAELTKALTGITCGGSEFFIWKGDRFVADIKACVEYVRKTRESQHRTIVEAIQARNAAAARILSLQAELERKDKALNTLFLIAKSDAKFEGANTMRDAAIALAEAILTPQEQTDVGAI